MFIFSNSDLRDIILVVSVGQVGEASKLFFGSSFQRRASYLVNKPLRWPVNRLIMPAAAKFSEK